MCTLMDSRVTKDGRINADPKVRNLPTWPVLGFFEFTTGEVAQRSGLDLAVVEANVRPGGDLMSKIDPEPVICSMLAEELLSNPPPMLASVFNTLIRSARQASGLVVPPEQAIVRLDHELIAKHPKIFPGGP